MDGNVKISNLTVRLPFFYTKLSTFCGWVAFIKV